MKAGILFERDGRAQQRILRAATELADRLGVAPTVLEQLKTQRGDPAVRAMQQREAIADLLEALVERSEHLVAAESEADSQTETKAPKSTVSRKTPKD